MEPGLDAPCPVRTGEEIDAAAVARCLAACVPGLSGDVAVAQFPAGHSNLTYLLTVGERELVLRRPPFGFKNVRAGHDMAREFRVLDRLHRVYPKAPRPYAFVSEEDSPFGAPFYVMERVRGVVLRAPLPSAFRDVSRLRDVSLELVATLAELHAVDYAGAGLADLGRPRGYVERQVRGWTDRYARARTDDVPDMERLATWLGERVPAESEPALLHNDFKLDNLVLAPPDAARVAAVLDWEMATVGDPLADLGTTLAYWIEADDPDELRASPFGITAAPGNLTRAEVAEGYARASGRDVGGIGFHYALGVFKVATIAQQIYARYAAGLTADPRFAAMLGAVRALAACGRREIERPRLPRA
jgi:aminoglycoside phosphotransferase (APT) family kinase protein